MPRKKKNLVLAAAAKLQKGGDLAEPELVAVRNFADGVLASRAEAKLEMFRRLAESEEKTALALWDAKALADLPPGETTVVKTFRWDGENRHSMEVLVRVKGFAPRAGRPRGVGLATEHPGVVALFLYLHYRETREGVKWTEPQALRITRELFPDAPGQDRIGRYRLAKRSFVAAVAGVSRGPFFEGLTPILHEQSVPKMVKALRAAEEAVETKPALTEYRKAVDFIEERSRLMLKEVRA
jgi:hypothetical protein